jgi:hypothetical protein
MNLRSIITATLCAIGISAEATSSQPQLAEEVSAKAKLAVAQLQARAGGKLDYSEKSLTTIEEMLEEASQYKNQMPKKDQEALVALIGSYILEVAHRTYGGKYKWSEQGDQPVLVVGEPKFHMAIMTFSKVRGRLSGDKADNIPFFYQGFSERVKAAVPSTKALYM